MFEKIREQPDHVKRNIALVSSGIISAVVFGFWIGGVVSEVKGVAHDTKEQSVSTFSELRSSLANSFSAIKEQYGQVKNTFSKIGEYQLNNKTE